MNLSEIKDRILSEKDWQSRSLDIELFHTILTLNKTKWSIRKTAKVLGLCASTVCEDLMLSKYSVKHPEVGKIRKRIDALNYVRNEIK